MAAHLLALFAFVGCASEGGVAPPTDPPEVHGIALTRVVSGLGTLTALAAPVGDPRIFLVEQTGRIRVLQNGELLVEPFLDLRSLTRGEGERGLLGLAFHPAYATNGRFFVNYTDLSGDTRVVEYRVSANPSRADPSTGSILLTIPQPFANHNGGDLAFGPDGMLYIATGDGGGGDDPLGNSQDTHSLLGKLLRINVSIPGVASLPQGNPFVGRPSEGRGEVWAWGLRNPWRISFDAVEGMLYIGDVGQSQREEIDVVSASAAGVNFGWPDMEGDECRTSGCGGRGFTAPAVTYAHSAGCYSVTGGAVYRGSALPALRGHYFYSDLCRRFVRSFRFEAGVVTDHRTWEPHIPDQVTSIGRDSSGEIYLLTSSGEVYRIDPAGEA